MPMPVAQFMITDDHLQSQIRKLLAYCQANDWAGYDPYDAVNSRVFSVLPFLNSRLPRLVLTQALKRSPINIRRLLFVPKTHNPKAIALFLSAFLNLSRIGAAKAGDLVQMMIERLIALRSQGIPYWCWGYSFPWQTRTIVVPRGAPNLVCTTFVGNALLDAYEQRPDARCLSMAARRRLVGLRRGAVAAMDRQLPYRLQPVRATDHWPLCRDNGVRIVPPARV